jgi:hypothetical protein
MRSRRNRRRLPDVECNAADQCHPKADVERGRGGPSLWTASEALQDGVPLPDHRFSNGDRRYDVQDLDGWIDSMKAGASSEVDDIVARLG